MRCILTPRALKGLCGLMVTLGIVYLFCENTQLLLNQSPSLNHKAFFIVKGLPARKGDLVSFRGHKAKYFSDVIFTKKIVGVAGEKIIRQSNMLWIEEKGRTPIFPLLPVTDEGEALTPLQATLIPQGYMFVKGDHPRSFDSRYEEFGLVKVGSFIGRTFALW
ncbi:MAG: S26 family signal peptidase [Alphaproteobacteria bacterium]|nr:S26 family signal peptidase [Alphaproteobacteria bacterium]